MKKKLINSLIILSIMMLGLASFVGVVQAAEPWVWEYYFIEEPALPDGWMTVKDVWWKGQTFEVTDGNHSVAYVGVQLTRWTSESYPGTITASIKATSAGKPTGADLTNGTIDGNAITTATYGAWYLINMDTEIDVVNGTTYSLVIRATSGDSSNYLLWLADVSSPAYANGTFVTSGNSGDSWSIQTNQDAMFAIWGTEAGGTTKYSLVIETTVGGTTNPMPGGYEYYQGAEVSIMAYESASYKFMYWTRDGLEVSTSFSYTVAMNTHHIVKAWFKEIEYVLGDLQVGYTTGHTQTSWAYGEIMLAQTFDAGAIPFTLTSVRLFVGKIGSPGIMRAEIRSTWQGKPTDDVLSYGTINADTNFVEGMLNWHQIYLVEPVIMISGNQYALVLVPVETTTDYSNKISWGYDDTNPTYEDGTQVRYWPTWTIYSGSDYLFSLWGTSAYEAPSLLESQAMMMVGVAFVLGFGGVGFAMGKDPVYGLFTMIIGLMIVSLIGWLPVWTFIVAIAVLCALLAWKFGGITRKE